MSGRSVQQAANQFLIVSIVFIASFFSIDNIGFTKRDRDLCGFIVQCQFFRRGQDISNNLHLTHWLSQVSEFPFHTSFSPPPVPGTNNSDFAFSGCESYRQDSSGNLSETGNAFFDPAMIKSLKNDTAVIERSELRRCQ